MGFFDFLINKLKQFQTSDLASRYDFSLVPHTFEGDGDDFDIGMGFVVLRNSDGQKLRWESLPDGLEAINVAGESYRIQNLQKPCFKAGSKIILIHEPDNPYGKGHAVAVYDINSKYQAGYIPSSESKRILQKMKNNEIDNCIVMWETFKNKKRISIRLLLMDKIVSLND